MVEQWSLGVGVGGVGGGCSVCRRSLPASSLNVDQIPDVVSPCSPEISNHQTISPRSCGDIKWVLHYIIVVY